MGASTVVLALVTPVNIALNIALVHHTSLGFVGSAFALSAVYWILFLVLILYTYLSPTHTASETWAGFQLRTVLDAQGCWVFLKLALPGILMVGTEWAAFEIVALAAGRLGPIPLAAQSVIMTTDQSKYSVIARENQTAHSCFPSSEHYSIWNRCRSLCKGWKSNWFTLGRGCKTCCSRICVAEHRGRLSCQRCSGLDKECMSLRAPLMQSIIC